MVVRLLKAPAQRLVRRLLGSAFFQEELWRSCGHLFRAEGPDAAGGLGRGDGGGGLPEPPGRYGLASATAAGRGEAAGPGPVFITARFRSGSTFLWQLFRGIDGVTGYYEPLNERRWFLHPYDSPSHDPTHRGVAGYGEEYAGMADLDRLFNPRWGSRDLYMDERSHHPRLYRYIAELVRRAPGRAVLQFNRVDLRLRWLRAHFPEATIVHLYRHPREQWLSIQAKGRVPLDCTLADFPRYDAFYLLDWARDLRRVFPFMEGEPDLHPYALHYYVWRLSHASGRAHADLSVAYEDLTADFEGCFGRLLAALSITGADVARLAALNRGPVAARWPEYADGAWFAAIEAACERVLGAHFAATGRRPRDHRPDTVSEEP